MIITTRIPASLHVAIDAFTAGLQLFPAELAAGPGGGGGGVGSVQDPACWSRVSTSVDAAESLYAAVVGAPSRTVRRAVAEVNAMAATVGMTELLQVTTAPAQQQRCKHAHTCIITA